MKYVVVIDDDKMVEEYLESFLRRADYREISFNDPREAFDFIKEHCDEIRLVITDLNMPQMTGVELGEEMMKVVSRIPVILFTAAVPPPLAEDLSNNVKIVLQKPLMRKQFMDAVEALIGQAQDVVWPPDETCTIVLRDTPLPSAVHLQQMMSTFKRLSRELTK